MPLSGTLHPVIQVSQIRKSYGATAAVADVSFDVIEGEVFGLIGPNGAGKTTTMECVEGVRRPDGGRISIMGLDPFRDVYEVQQRIGAKRGRRQFSRRQICTALLTTAEMNDRGGNQRYEDENDEQRDVRGGAH